FNEALEKLQIAVQIKEEILGRIHSQVATSLNNLGMVLRSRKEHDAALAMFIEATEISEKCQGEQHPATAVNMFNWAVQLNHLNRLEESLPLFVKATKILEQRLGPIHPNVCDAHSSLGNTYRELGEMELSATHLAKSIAGSLQYVDRELPTMSEADRLTLLRVAASPYSFFESLLAYPESDLGAAFSLYAQWKGKATRLQKASLSLARKNQTPEFLKQKADLRRIGTELANLLFIPQSEQAEDHDEQIQELRSARLRLEREINLALDFSDTLSTPDFAAIQQALPDDTVLVDFFAGKEVYGWVVKKHGPPILLYFGMPDKLRAAQDLFLHQRTSRGGRNFDTNGESEEMKIGELLWEPLRPHVEGAKKILVCPDGFLCELPLGILPQGEGGFLLENFQFVYLSDPSQVVQPSSTLAQNRAGDVVVIGDVNYFRRAQQGEESKPNPAQSTRSRVGDSWSSLEGTREELRSIQDLHKYVLEWETKFDRVDGKEATEERVREMLPSHRYIHIATHGYFEPDSLPSLLEDAMQRQATAQITEQVRAVGSLPGLLSGLVFAGVNGESDPNRDDGYLSAEEIQHLDLSACDLAVLSACETALGSKRAGEGLMSLRRAFEVAGAKSVLSSLWKVDDQSTAQLMKDFYTNLWEKKMSRGVALHQAKLRTLRRNRIENAGNAMPSTWGAFVLSGEWN
ncbi:MAG: CHAT domain-containing protein, partial [Planctomycetes bacterium]|nr:CHAT domain-containing protein [Planctomycetota bacterium]